MSLKVNRGTTFPITVTYYSSAGVTGDLTGGTVFFTVKEVKYDSDTNDSTAKISKTLSGANLTDPTNGKTSFKLDPLDTDDLSPETDYHYDVKVKLASGDIFKIDEGTLKIDASPTNRLS